MTESRIEARIRELGYELPVAPAPVAVSMGIPEQSGKIFLNIIHSLPGFSVPPNCSAKSSVRQASTPAPPSAFPFFPWTRP